ncbi:MAG: hypothetical protein AB7T01_11630 [Acidithiobacillus sp.]
MTERWPFREKGQALTEVVVVAGFVLVPLLILGVYVGKWGYLQDRSIEAARYAAWERVVSPAAPPAGRAWASLKSDADLQKEVSIRFFGGRNERLTAVTGSAGAAGLATGSSREPLLRKHDGQPLLVQREQNITVATRQEAFDGGWTSGVSKALNRLAGNPLQMTGPTVAAVTVSAAGLPQRIFAEVGLGDPLQFKAQAAVLTDPWTANGPGEEERLLREGFMKPQAETSKLKSLPVVGFNAWGEILYWLGTPWGFPLGNMFGEYEKYRGDPDRDRLKIDTEQQFGDRLQPYPPIPPYPGP